MFTVCYNSRCQRLGFLRVPWFCLLFSGFPPLLTRGLFQACAPLSHGSPVNRVVMERGRQTCSQPEDEGLLGKLCPGL